MSWSAFEEAAPEMARGGRRLLYRDGIGQGLLATVAGDDLPRLHPVYVAVTDDRLFTFISRSAKRSDLEIDGRYALHAHLDPRAPSEFSVSGHATPVDGDASRKIATTWYFEPGDAYRLFELSVENAHHGERSDPDAWPPIYTHWRAPATTDEFFGRPRSTRVKIPAGDLPK